MTQSAKQVVELLNAAGLHARPAAVLAERARQFRSELTLILASVPEDMGVAIGTRADAKSVMDLLFLAAPCGTQLEIEAVGDDAEEAVIAIVGLFAERFGLV